MLSTSEITTRDYGEASELGCPRCGAFLLHHIGVTSFDRREDAQQVVKTRIESGRVNVDPEASGSGNPSTRRDGLVIDFWCEGCGDAPIELCIAQHKGSTEISWRYAPAEQSSKP